MAPFAASDRAKLVIIKEIVQGEALHLTVTNDPLCLARLWRTQTVVEFQSAST